LYPVSPPTSGDVTFVSRRTDARPHAHHL